MSRCFPRGLPPSSRPQAGEGLRCCTWVWLQTTFIDKRWFKEEQVCSSVQPRWGGGSLAKTDFWKFSEAVARLPPPPGKPFPFRPRIGPFLPCFLRNILVRGG
jgi:hypothetical protein